MVPDTRLRITIENAASLADADEQAAKVAAEFWKGKEGRVEIAQQVASTNTVDVITADGKVVVRGLTFDVTYLADITEPL